MKQDGRRCLSEEILAEENFALRQEVEFLRVGLEEVSRALPFLKLVWENEPGGVFLETLDGSVVDCNPAGCRMFGYRHEEIVHLNIQNLVPGYVLDTVPDVLAQGEARGNSSSEMQTIRSDGTCFLSRIYVHTVELHGEPFLLTYVHDISDSKKTEEALRLQAYTDGLTGLWNRAFFQRRFFEEMERVRRYGSHLSLVMFDIDHFKVFNDTHGHLCGDKALVRIADLVQKTIRVSDCFARWGGDEFLVFSPVPEEGALVFAERLRQKVKEARWPRDMRLTLSLGVIEATGDLSSEILMDRVDRAMYRAKRAGGDRVCVWGAESPDGVTHTEGRLPDS